jgi:poly-gamma-glutamate synthesis protein (capsule biosynthesis protein)
VTRYDHDTFRRVGRHFRIGGRHGIVKRASQVLDADRNRNLQAVSAAARSADLTVVSLHAHTQGAWQAGFIRDVIVAGGDIVHIHGPHEICGVEFIDDCPVFHGLGDFVYEADKFAVQPSDAYTPLGLDDRAGPSDLIGHPRTGPGQWSVTRTAFEGCAALVRYGAERRPEVTLLPIDLQFDASRSIRGRPQLADRDLGRRLIAAIAEKSRRYGTSIRYDAATNTGVVDGAA